MVVVLVTVGTFEFDALVERVLEGKVLQVLRSKFPSSCMRLMIQKGQASKFEPSSSHWLLAEGLGIQLEFLSVVSDFSALIQAVNFVICHAGAGSILELLAAGKAFLAVPNESLMENHQLEFAQKLLHLSLIIVGHLESIEKDLLLTSIVPKAKVSFPTIRDFPIY